jgi:hypothetical protein
MVPVWAMGRQMAALMAIVIAHAVLTSVKARIEMLGPLTERAPDKDWSTRHPVGQTDGNTSANGGYN